MAVLPNVLVCNSALGIDSVAGLATYARPDTGKVSMASAGPGSVSHLAGIALTAAAGFESLHVP